MNPVQLFISRPIATTLVMLGILLFGVVGYTQLPVSDLPNVEFPTITVSANLPGANPGTMAASVATPLEAEFSAIAGLDNMSSTSSMGSVSISLQFDLSRSIDAAAQDVQAAISTAVRKLPQDMPAPPTLRKVNPADAPVLFLTVASKTLPLYQVNEYADKMIGQRLSMINGVAQLNIFGSQKYAVRIQLNPREMSAKNLGVNEVADAIRQGNSNLPIGTVYADEKNYTIKSNGQLENAAAYRSLIVAHRDGAPIYLGDIAAVIDSVENTRQASWYNGERAITLAIQKQPGTNTIKLIDEIKAMLPQIQADLPASVSLRVLFDRSVSIRHSVADVQFTLVLTIFLVVLVIYLFLGNFSATWIASLALPMAIVGTFAIMSLLGFSLNNLSLMALTLAVGFVIDDAIVVLENIMRYLEMGESPMSAALKGTREIGFTVISMTISLIAVFIPILFMGGLLGRLFKEFALTMTAAILVSGFVSLTLTPMLCSRFLKIGHGPRNPVIRVSEWLFGLMASSYKATLGWCLRFKPLVLLAFFGLVGLTVFVFNLTPKGFMPTDDIGQVTGVFEAEQGQPFEEMVAYQQKAAALVRKNPNVAAVMSSVDGSNSGRMFIILKPFGQRAHVEDVVKELRPKLGSIAGIQAFLQIPQSIRLGGGRPGKAAYQLTLLSPDTDALYQGTAALEEKLKEVPGLLDVSSDVQLKNPQLILRVDREKAAALGLSQTQVESALSGVFGTRQISTIYAPTNDYQVIFELDPAYSRDMDSLSQIFVKSGSGEMVPVSTIATVERAVGPLSVTHQGPFPSTNLTFNLPPNVALGDVVGKIEAAAASSLPANVRYQFQGTAQIFQDSLQGLGWLLLLAVLVIYLVLGILYESFIHPVTILSGLPPAGLGALWALVFFGQELNIYGFLGLILLIGIVKKNAIMMIDFALEQQRMHGKIPQDAIYEACLVRFRPIMMTTFAALMGTLPIALAEGPRRSLGLAVFGGLIVSQLLTLYITPVLYVYLDRLTGGKKSAVGPGPGDDADHGHPVEPADHTPGGNGHDGGNGRDSSVQPRPLGQPVPHPH